MMSLKESIKDEAQRLGFQLFGVTTPHPPPHLEVYEQWLAAGHHAGMNWMSTERSRQRRADPCLILPACHSILVLGMAYPSPSFFPSEHGGETGEVAAYAWGDDYHDVLPPRLKAIVAFIEAQVGHPVPSRWYTDTGPILERDLAQRAGLGWIGKNTCLINPKAGSYFLLAEILLGIELPPDEPITRDYCGSCTRCLEACPTNCILPNRTIDSNRCISYLTIEEKGAIPFDLRVPLGTWIFGCDICQQVCPWNLRFAPPPRDPPQNRRGQTGEWAARPILRDEVALTAQEFKRKFKDSPIKRAKRRGYLRNIAIALGNTGNAEAIPALARALGDPEPLLRGHAAWALGQIGEAEARQALHAALISETDDSVQREIEAALHKIAKC